MKVLDNGQIKLAQNEKRVGNFIIKDEGEHIKLMDINSLMSHRVSKTIAMGQFLDMLYKGLKDDAVRKTAENYLAVLWSFSCCIPDVEFCVAVYEAAKASLERNRAMYGLGDAEQTDEADAEALEAIKEEAQLQEEAAKVAEEIEKEGE